MSACNSEKQVRDLLEVTLREHHVAGQVLGDCPLFDMVFTDKPMQTYQNTLTADLQKYRVFHRALFHHGVFKSPWKNYVSLVHSHADVEAPGKAFDAAMARVAQLS